MKVARILWQYISFLSLDVVFGAMGGMLFFSGLLDVHIAAEIYLLLGTAVWCIYTGDHLLDARQARELVSPRHQFHQKYQWILLIEVFVFAVLGIGSAMRFLGWGKELYYSVLLGLLILGMMILLRKAGKAAGLLKELSTAVFYVLGVAWIPLLRTDRMELHWKSLSFLACYMALAFLNLLMLSLLDQKEDRTQGFSSAASILGSEKLETLVKRLNLILIFLGLVGSIFLQSYYRPYSFVLLGMVLVHYLTFFNKQISPEAKRKRMEAAFLIPWLLLLWT